MASAMILAAGLGTRLRPLSLELPKPVVPVGDRPLLAHVAERLRDAGCAPLVVNVHHWAPIFVREIEALPFEFHVSHEKEIRGTAGGVAAARGLLGSGTVLVWNGDVLTRPPLERLRERAELQDAQVLAVRSRARGEGTVGLAADGKVVRLRGRSFGEEVAGGDYVGVMALSESVCAALPEHGCLVGDVALPALERGQPVWSVVSDAPFCDLGDLASYVQENFRWLAERVPSGGSWVEPSARVEPGVQLDRCIIGRGARVTGRGVLSRTIVWPGALAEAPGAAAVVLRSGLRVRFDADRQASAEASELATE